MKNKNEFSELTDKEIDEEIKARKEMLPQLIGNLWPGVLWDEIKKLEKLKEDPFRRVRLLVNKQLEK